jgi:hypothetical protein
MNNTCILPLNRLPDSKEDIFTFLQVLNTNNMHTVLLVGLMKIECRLSFTSYDLMPWRQYPIKRGEGIKRGKRIKLDKRIDLNAQKIKREEMRISKVSNRWEFGTEYCFRVGCIKLLTTYFLAIRFVVSR